jgi:ATP synthase protein I
MSEPEKTPSLDDLDARLREIRERDQGKGGGGPVARQRPEGAALGFRIGIELVTAVAVGAGIGWGLDSWLGTKPWLMMLFLLLGGAAGVLNVYRLMKGMDDTVGGGAARGSQEMRSKDH